VQWADANARSDRNSDEHGNDERRPHRGATAHDRSATDTDATALDDVGARDDGAGHAFALADAHTVPHSSIALVRLSGASSDGDPNPCPDAHLDSKWHFKRDCHVVGQLSRRRVESASCAPSYIYYQVIESSMLLFGKKRKRRLLGNAYPIDCPECAHSVYYNLLKVTTRLWFIIPVKGYTRFYLTCPACDSVLRLNDSAAKMGTRLVEQTSSYQANQIDEQEYTEFLTKFDKQMGIERYYEAQVDPEIIENIKAKTIQPDQELPEYQ